MNVLKNETTYTLSATGNTSPLLISTPIIALAFGFCEMKFQGTDKTYYAGKTVSITCLGITLRHTLHTTSTSLSLLPFIRAAVNEANAIDKPLLTDSTSSSKVNPFRGTLTLAVSCDGVEALSCDVPYIYGGQSPMDTPQTRWLTYNAGVGYETFTGIDLADNFDENTGLPLSTAWVSNWLNLNHWLAKEPNGSGREMVDEAVYFKGGRIYIGHPITLNLLFDSRTVNVRLVKWLDAFGNINERKFTFSGDSTQPSIGASYDRFHATDELDLASNHSPYYRGYDRWAEINAARSITLGDDNIPIECYTWLSQLATSPCIEVEWSLGNFMRVNIASCELTIDPRKTMFSMTMIMTAPTHTVQMF